MDLVFSAKKENSPSLPSTSHIDIFVESEVNDQQLLINRKDLLEASIVRHQQIVIDKGNVTPLLLKKIQR